MLRTPYRLRAALAALALPVAAAACGPADASGPPAPAGPPARGSQTVLLADNTFGPAALRVVPGTTITWEWRDGPTPHDVTFDDFASQTQSGGAYTHTFTTPGEFAYRCSLHPKMTGLVVVQ